MGNFFVFQKRLFDDRWQSSAEESISQLWLLYQISYPKYKYTAKHIADVVEDGQLRKTLNLFKKRKFVVAVVLYCLTSFSVIGVEEMFPLFAATKIQYQGKRTVNIFFR